jgi:hypothetical protein
MGTLVIMVAGFLFVLATGYLGARSHKRAE